MISNYDNSWKSKKKQNKKREKKKNGKKKERKTKKETVAKKKVWKRFGCLIFEHEIEAFRGVFLERESWIKSPYLDSPLNSYRFDI